MDKPRVLLIKPHSPVTLNLIPLGLGYIAGELENHGCHVRIIDMSAHYASITINDVVEEIGSFSPHLIGFSIDITSVRSSHRLSEEISKLDTKAPLVCGGYYPTQFPRKVLDHHFDIAVRGEGEETICELVDLVMGKRDIKDISGITYKKDKEIFENPPREPPEDLDKVPFPARHLFDENTYIRDVNERINLGGLVSSRGCPYRCSYCCLYQMSGHVHRYRSAENIIREIRYMMDRYHINEFSFNDDIFTLNKERVKVLC